jgi:hypothetical protein
MVSTLEFGALRVPVAEPGADSPWPLLPGTGKHATVDGADAEMTANVAYGQPETLLPYHAQDGYRREPVVSRDCRVAVLANGRLRATFLVEYGGRLWSLVDLVTGRELLHRPAVLQPANLALRNAWFAGGVEWNLGATGHWGLTCAPVHAGRLDTPDGTPVLRLWAYERLRRLVWRIDAWLPPSSGVLLVRPRLHNPHGDPVPVYWWSNIAVPEEEGTRVVAPATEAFHFGYEQALRRVPFPGDDGEDRSYPARAATAADYFFDIPAGRRRFIAAVDAAGDGLVQTSTDLLRGRKMFVWGTGRGGRRWQRWLGGTQRYLEIQAGLARTQLEHLPLPPATTWTWTEAYGPLRAEVAGDWTGAGAAVEAGLETLIPTADLEAAHAAAETWADTPPTEILATGDGWGALEVRVGTLPEPPGTPFPESTLGPQQQPWLDLQVNGHLPTPPSTMDPAATCTGPGWHRLLEEDRQPDWHTYLHLGLARLAAGDPAGARAAWEASTKDQANPWALRNLAELDTMDAHGGDVGSAADRLVAAHRLMPGNWQLTAETLRALLAVGRAGQALDLIDALDESQREHGRIRLYECRAALGAGEVDRAGRILAGGLEIVDLREGEESLDALWADYQRATGSDEALPDDYDFRMS